MESPQLAGFAWEVRAAEAQTLQASQLPNPQIGIEVENFAGSGELNGFDGSETTVSVSQVFPLGGKVQRQTDLATLERDLASWDYETHRTEALVEATRRFVNVLAAQNQLRLAQQSQRLATLVHEAVTKRVDAGDAAPMETTRTGVLVAVSRIEAQRAQRSLRVARYRLAETWGSTKPRFESVVGPLDHVAAVPSFEALDRWVNDNPVVSRWATHIAQRRAAIELAKAQGVPDLEVEGGLRYLNESNDTALVVGLSLPLPLFNRNQGGVLEARYNLANADAQRHAATVRWGASLAAGYEELTSTHAEATALRDEVLPTARSAFEAVQSAFEQGGGGYLDMLDAQRTLTELQRQYIDALARYHHAVAEIEGLIGRPLHAVDEPTTVKQTVETHGDLP